MFAVVFIGFESFIFFYKPSPYVVVADAMVNGQAVLLAENRFKQIELDLGFLFVCCQCVHNRIAAVDDEFGFLLQALDVVERISHSLLGDLAGLYVDIGNMGKTDGSLAGRCG